MAPPFVAVVLVDVHNAHSIENPISKSPTLDVFTYPESTVPPFGLSISAVPEPKYAFWDATF
ncbi:MAG: hypothetical protein DME05_25640 [Candidatus Rokuibacteriota bacterium]|nr:MAG: hypothetical protein DME05_25640 [Candidatus Rokubacteria bacterium]